MAAKVRWNDCCFFLVLYVISVNGMFVHRHCSHIHPKHDEVSVSFRTHNDNEIFRSMLPGYLDIGN
jgi:hypothetical protein